uniref:NADH-ubiquinone oxidoreductase chain 5 n=1 Tax=Ulva compressa TaxID=63659 RepID=A0A3S6P7H8_ULVCO|nr:NADH-ubiquinone oxidoreductase chain 5 [Ulva compressa]ARO34868.1 NADH-ubiquinone oxidoreductase chain 5 [Ulva compressa]ATP01487.1 NADH-ubiquinone oxidoreductase chain 5 [Ulva compressa]QDF43134.1 NADH-ubiquinone oxidoreductase chain 5 [Ulva compressa]
MYLALLTLPLITFVCIGLFGRFIGPRGTIVLSLVSAVSSALISFTIFYEVALCRCPCQITYASYFHSGLFDANWGFLFDTLTAVMCVVVTLISCLVVLYSCSYMIEDPHFIRFISYLKLFTVAMLMLVTADNYIQLFVGWEGVGLASFLLISFWFTRLQASKAAIQAMLLNRVGDIALALGIICLFFCYKTTSYQALFTCVANFYTLAALQIGGYTSTQWSLLDFSCVLLFIGAMGKSGQFGLHAWLPNAMNAPTPVSALLHAATMVTAGVFLLARTSPLLEFAPYATVIIAVIGAITTIFAGTIGLVQNDFKSIIAYSTCSQLGYMVTICGLSNYNVGIFHLFNHAFFKALLFLTAGAVIHALANEQDVRKFAGLQQILIFSYTALLIGTLALVGTPFLTGFYSKDVILELAYARYSIAAHFSYLLTCFSVFTTSYYSFRLLFLCFHTNINQLSETHSQHKYARKNNLGYKNKYTNIYKQYAGAHDADWVMGVVLLILAVGSIYAGWFFKPMFIGLGSDFWNNSIFIKPNNGIMIEAEFLPQFVKTLPLVLTISGAIIAYLFSITWVSGAYQIASNHLSKVYLFLNQRWFYDKILNELVAYNGYKLGLDFVKIFDKGLLELLPMFGLGLPKFLKSIYIKLGATQSGLIYHYATIMIIGAMCGLTTLCFTNVVLFIDFRIFVLMVACLLIV